MFASFTTSGRLQLPHYTLILQALELQGVDFENIKQLVDDGQCYQTVRALRWPDGIACPSCQSKYVIKRGFDDTEPARQRYECHDCDQRFDDLTDTVFAGHHQPLKVWVLCLYFMGLNVSNEQIAQELEVNVSDVQQMTMQLRQGIIKKSPP